MKHPCSICQKSVWTDHYIKDDLMVCSKCMAVHQPFEASIGRPCFVCQQVKAEHTPRVCVACRGDPAWPVPFYDRVRVTCEYESKRPSIIAGQKRFDERLAQSTPAFKDAAAAILDGIDYEALVDASVTPEIFLAAFNNEPELKVQAFCFYRHVMGE